MLSFLIDSADYDLFYKLSLSWHSKTWWSPLWTSRFVAAKQLWPQSFWLLNLRKLVYQTKAQDVS